MARRLGRRRRQDLTFGVLIIGDARIRSRGAIQLPKPGSGLRQPRAGVEQILPAADWRFMAQAATRQLFAEP